MMDFGRALRSRLQTVISLALLLLTLAACGGPGQGPTTEVVAQAVQAQAQQAETTLWQKLGDRTTAAPTLQVKAVTVKRTRTLTLLGQRAYEVSGTYRLKLRYPSRRVTQTRVPFQVVLQPGATPAQWQVLTAIAAPDGSQTWHRQVLSSPEVSQDSVSKN